MNLIDFNNGTITVTTTGGTAPYSFLLQQNGSTFNYGGSNFVNPISSSSGTVVFGNAADTTGQSGLPAGDYTCQITDSNGCILNTPTLTVQQNVPATTTEAPTYTVTINPVANPSDVFGQYPMVSSGLSAGDSYTIPSPTFGVTGHNFLGYDTYSGTPMAEPQYQPGDVITISGNTNLYARYQLIPTTLATTLATTTEATTTQLTVSLTANANPSDIVPAENFTTNYNVSFGSTYTFPGPTFGHSQGWIFSGWSPFPNGGTPTFQPGDTTVINNSGTFYAQWTIPTTTIAPTTEATTTEATTTEATTTEATTTEATTTEATTTEATTTEATTTEATTTEATTTEATTTEATTTEATTTQATTQATTQLPTFDCDTAGPIVIPDGITNEFIDISSITLANGTVTAISPQRYLSGVNTFQIGIDIPSGYYNGGSITCTADATGIDPTTLATTTEATTTEATTTEATTTEATTTEATTTEATTTEATTTEATTTEATTTVAQETGYYFHLGTGAYPWQQQLISGNVFYYPDNNSETTFAPIFEDMLTNPSGYPGFDPNDSFTTLIDGAVLNYPANANGNYYWLLLPDSYNIPDLTQNAKLSINGAPDDICSEKGALTINGIAYTLYKLNTVPTTAGIAVTYNA